VPVVLAGGAVNSAVVVPQPEILERRWPDTVAGIGTWSFQGRLAQVIMAAFKVTSNGPTGDKGH
jgi:hypothetical protein